MKKALIVGSSHSESSCRRHGEKKIERLKENRWHDYLKTDHGYDVINLSRANCTTQQQLAAVVNYLKKHPHQRFDLAIVEGRNVETTISMPVERLKSMRIEKVKSQDIYKSWLDGDQEHKNQVYDKFSPLDSHKVEDEHPDFYPWFMAYTHSYQHMIDTWSCNRALCSLLDDYSGKVLWHTHNISKDLQEVDHEYNQIGYMMMKKWCAFGIDQFPMLEFSKDVFDYEGDFCACGHFNEEGHRKLWHDILYPAYKWYL